MIAQALRLHQTTIDHHISEFLNKGKLKPENGGADSAVVYDDTNRTLKAQAAAEPAEDALTEAQTVMPTIKVTATVDATYQIMR